MRKRQYKKQSPFRDASLFVIACEGEKREYLYFKELAIYLKLDLRKVKLEIIPSEAGNSSPEHVYRNILNFTRGKNLNKNDQFWMAIDTDRWKKETIVYIINQIQEKENWEIVISNPCFETWLFLHIKNISEASSNSCKQFKRELHQITENGYNELDFVTLYEKAILRAKNICIDKRNIIPEFKSTTIFRLVESLQKFSIY